MKFKKNYYIVPNNIFSLMLKPAEFCVLSYLLRCSDDDFCCFPSIHTIAVSCSISDNTVRKSISGLEKRGIIKKAGGFGVSKFSKTQSASYVFSINADIFTPEKSLERLTNSLKAEQDETNDLELTAEQDETDDLELTGDCLGSQNLSLKN